ncbi:MAG TPA: T9SS type A sorting domain-containing protein [Chitinophagaceae bacterium]|nr:T9SS type A sorting domain-containing protein [Chitinophagaceae bacterium]
MKNLLLGICLLVSASTYSQQVARSLTAPTGLFIGFYEYTPTDYNVDPSKKYPLIIFLHGIGERGNGTTELPRVLTNAIPKYINAGHQMRFTSLAGTQETFLVLSPQLSASQGSWQNIYVEEMLKYAKANLRVDTNRIYLTGLSLGGGGTWKYASASLGNARQFAAIAPVCGICDFGNMCNIAAANLPVWAFHAINDSWVQASCTNSAINMINSCNPSVKPIKTIYPNGDHWIWDRSYDTTHGFHNPNMYEWFLGHAKNLPANSIPIANAGPDRTVTLPLSSVTLSGSASTDLDGSIMRASWAIIQSPGGGWMQNANTINAQAHNLSQGVYRFELTVVDNRAGWAKDTVTITVNPTSANLPPVAAAGNDAVTAQPSVALDATSSYDPDGFISNYAWRQVGGPGAAGVTCTTCPNPVVTMPGAGTYALELEVIDNIGARTKDTVYITEMTAVVPVDFLYFKGKNIGKNNILQWATANEFNNLGFEVQRSSDGMNYTTVTFVKGAGTATQISDYSYTDQNAPQQVSYYRLRQVDTDKQYKYSRVITINNANSKLSLEYYPNPVTDQLQVQLQSADKGAMRIRLLSMDGKVVREQNLRKDQEILSSRLDVRQLQPGMYIIEIVTKDWTEIRKLVKK